MHDPHAEDHQHYTIPPGESDPKTLATVVVGVLGVLVTGLIILGLEVVYYKTERREFQRKVVDVEPAQLRSVEAAQLEKLRNYRMVDEATGQVAIPIEHAMERVVAEDRKRRDGGKSR